MDFRGQSPGNTFRYLINSDGTFLYNGYGELIDNLYLTTSYAIYQISQEISSSFASQSISCSYLNGIATASLFGTSSWSINSSTSSYITSSKIIGNITSFSSSWASSSISSSYLNNFNFNVSSSITKTTSSNVVILQTNTGSYNTAWFDYSMTSGSNVRGGSIIASWLGNYITYNDYFTIDSGSVDTSQVTMAASLSGTYIQLLANVSTTYSWSIKAFARYL